MIRIILAYLVIGLLITILTCWDYFGRWIEEDDDSILTVVEIVVIGSLLTPIWTVQNFAKGIIEIFRNN